MQRIPASVPVLVLAAGSASVSAQFSVTVLHPAGASESYGLGISAQQQVGSVSINGILQAALWTGSAQGWVSFHPAGALSSVARRTDGERQFGSWRSSSNTFRAAIWSGTGASLQSLPPATGSSFIYAASGSILCGSSNSIGTIWSGNPLAPTALISNIWSSSANATDGVRFAGYYTIYSPSAPGFEFYQHAALWPSAASGPLDLHPPSLGEESVILAISGNQQVGLVRQYLGILERACLWNGSAASAVPLHPTLQTGQFDWSWITATTGEFQCGQAYLNGLGRRPEAFLWRGTRESAMSLHPFLPPQYTDSTANQIIEVGGLLQIIGTALDPVANAHHAVMWVGLPCYANCDRSTQAPLLNVSDFSCFLQRFAAGEAYANCDGSTQAPLLNVADFSCFLQKFAAGCTN